MLFKIILCLLFVTSVFSAEHVFLKTPIISKENIIGTNVGIRPFRKTGVRIEAETVGDKFIIHNYGYGGSGLTLCFGGVLEVMDILDGCKIPSKTVAILGAGVAGLTTAYELLARGYTVHIYADEWSPNLTSNVAAGIWTPLIFPKDLPEDKKELHLRMLKNSESRFLKSVCPPPVEISCLIGADRDADFEHLSEGNISEDKCSKDAHKIRQGNGKFQLEAGIRASPEFAGVRMIASYNFKTKASQESERMKQGEEIIAHFDNGVIRNGRRIYELGIDGQLFMNDLYLKVKKNGAVLKRFHFELIDEIINLEELIIINCTSMGAFKLFKDQEIMPVRGQLVYFKTQKEIDYLYCHNIDNVPDASNLFFVSIYPWSDRMILGGVYEKDQKEPFVTPEIIDNIIDNAEKCLLGIL